MLFAGCLPASRHAGYDSEFGRRFSSSSPYPVLQRQIESLLPDSLFPPSNVSIKVASLHTGEVLYELNSRLLFTPGSNQKLLTAAAALHELGREFQLSTLFSVDTSSGMILAKGFGDPLLTTQDIDSAAHILRPLLADDKEWMVAGDVSYFDDQYWGRGWMWDDEPDPTAMFISPLSVNGNVVRMRVGPGIAAGDSLMVTVEPPTSFVTVENEGVTTADSVLERAKVTRLWREHSNLVKVGGQMRIGDSSRTYALSVLQPEYYTVTLLAERLKVLGVRIIDTFISDSEFPPDRDSIQDGAFEVLRLSHRLDSVITYMNRTSDNLSAENLVKVLAAERRAVPGAAVDGLSVVRSFLAGRGIDTTQIVTADGSGVSRYNLLSTDVLVKLLTSMYADTTHFPIFYNSLAGAGEFGSLSNRMTGTPAGGNLRAKTGTLNGVCALSGYVMTADGEPLAFAMLMQNYAQSARIYRDVQDRIGVLLSRIRRSEL